MTALIWHKPIATIFHDTGLLSGFSRDAVCSDNQTGIPTEGPTPAPSLTNFRVAFDDETATQRKGMLSRTEKISGFHLKVSRQERELYEEFCNSAEAELLREMRDYFTEAKQKSGVINFDRLGMWSKIQNRIDLWLREACIWRHLNPNQVPRAREAIWHRVKDQLAKTIRETLGAGVDGGGTLSSRQ